MMMSNILVFISTIITANAFYSISYSADEFHPQVVGDSGNFRAPPTANQVADIYSRIAGLAPILREDVMNLPTADPFSEHKSLPVLLEVRGGKLPTRVQTLFEASAFETDQRGPSLDDVRSILLNHNIKAEYHTIYGGEYVSNDVANWLKTQTSPVVILHHETPASHHYIQRHRMLASSDYNSTNVTALTEFQIAQYQICLWTGVIMVLLVLAAVCALYNMEIVPDSLLYAKFQATRTQKND